MTCLFPFSTFTAQSFIWTVFRSIFFSSRGSSVAEFELLYTNFPLTEREGRTEEYDPTLCARSVQKRPRALLLLLFLFACFLFLLQGITALQTD